ncbi:MAG: ABC transporter substrate-binding protein [Chloroflexaceae bacterium]|nr:ABC transporter substrate-binding protein [Chloroflexaceae bacterium]
MTKFHALTLLVGLLVLGMVVSGGCGLPPDTPPPDGPAGEAADGAPEVRDVSMRLQWFPQYQFAGYLVAKVRGYYDEAGLKVSIFPGSPDFVPLPLVVSGSDTFGSTGADTILLARQKGIEVVALATIFQTSPVGFMVHRGSGIEQPQDFVGRTVGVFYGDNVETEYRALLSATGVDRAALNEVPAQFNMEPFLSRRVDVWPVYMTDQPDLARRSGAEVDLIVARDYGVVLMGDVLFASEAFVREHPAAAQAFVSATLRGWEYAVTYQNEAVSLIAEYDPQLSLEHLKFEATETINLVRYGAGERCLGWSDRETWEAEQQQLLDLGLLEAPVAFDVAVDNRFVAEYHRRQGKTCGEPESPE